MRHTRNLARGLVVLASPVLLAAPVFAKSSGAAAPGPTFNAGGGEPVPVSPPRAMSVPQAVLLGVVEGVTEYLPVSSTGHLTVVQGLLGLWATPEEKSASDAYAICIQLGAILAVFLDSTAGSRAWSAASWAGTGTACACWACRVRSFPRPSSVFSSRRRIKHYLYGIWPVAAAWLVGGSSSSPCLRSGAAGEGAALESLGLADGADHRACPGDCPVARSEQEPGHDRRRRCSSASRCSAAVEFSFLLGLLTLGAATIYEGLKLGPEIVHAFGWVSPLVGLVVAAASPRSSRCAGWWSTCARGASPCSAGTGSRSAILAGVLVVGGLRPELPGPP